MMITTSSRWAALVLFVCSVISAVSAAPLDITDFSAVSAAPVDVTANDDFSAENHYNANCPNMCKGVPPRNSSYYFCRDSRLGPKKLPSFFPLNDIVTPYDRLGGLCAAEFLAKWTKDGEYTHPDKDGFLLNTAGEPIKGFTSLLVGTLLDRFGSEYGKFFSPAQAPYGERAIPPQNLDTPKDMPEFPYNYHVYRVIKTFDVEAGPIAPYYGQAGAGTQYVTKDGAMKLITDGFLERVPLK